ncbi:MAG: dienelactone hydrolase family protein [Sulfuritalea sp.]|nr:dienelactone hydrolase family protein [Sulfuritalea sp.]
MALAADESSVKTIYDAVLGKYPDLATYCKLADAERRQIVVGTTMQLAGERKVSDPFVSGAEAGARLRKECGLGAISAADLAKLRWTASAKPLVFDGEKRSVDDLTDIRALGNAIYTPAGPGPFPAAVISHTNGGISQHLLVHARELLAAGFAVLVVDTYGPRGIKLGSGLFPAESAKDAYDALTHLQAQAYINKNRIFQTGYSLGAFAAALLASPQSAEAFGARGRFRATVANYGSCAIQESASTRKLDMLSADSDRPILMLMAELDIEVPPKHCFPLLEEMKAAGKDVNWHLYPKTTHGWDKAENSGYVYRLNNETMTYRFDAEVAKDATARMIAFFNKYQ